ncbi:hypothetical protein [Cohnella cellulosilytica]|uniref:Uncharacterized protein n=1 Tax=Cohnella cellulosilytica TaxID=986710 RepID=A0ABW2F513_9BACL
MKRKLPRYYQKERSAEMKRMWYALIVLGAFFLVPHAASAGTNTGISPNVPVVDNLESKSDADSFKITLPQPGSLQIKFDFPIAGGFEVEVQKSDADGTLSTLQSVAFTTDKETVTGSYTLWANKLRVAAGDYLIKVNFYDRYPYKYSSEDYILTAEYTAEPGNDYEKQPNGSTDLATPIALSSKVTGNLESTLDVDYYKIALLQPGSLQVEFNFPIAGSYEVEVFEQDAAGVLSSRQKVVFDTSEQSTTGLYTQWASKLRLAAGDYYLKVNYYDRYPYKYSSRDYALVAEYKPEPGSDYEKQPNGSIGNATPILWNAKVTGNLESKSDLDYYKISLPQSANLQVQFEFPIAGSYEVEVLKSDSRGVVSSLEKFRYDTDKSTTTGLYKSLGNKLRAAAGDYYVKVNYYDRYPYKYSSLDYKLTVLSNIAISATPVRSSMTIDGKKVNFDGYEILNNNYFKLRDLAFALNGTDKQFEITWDSRAQAIGLLSGERYTATGKEMLPEKNRKKVVVTPAAATLTLDGRTISITAYTIGNNSYFKLRDIAKMMDFAIRRDSAAHAISIVTNERYEE